MWRRGSAPSLSTIGDLTADNATTTNVGTNIDAHETRHPVLVVDFGAQYAQLIARRVRELSVFSEIVSHRLTAAEMAAKNPAAIILSGGPKSVHVEGAPQLDPAIYDLGVPIFGICYGAQLIAQQLGGTVGRGVAWRVRPSDAALSPIRRRRCSPVTSLPCMTYG